MRAVTLWSMFGNVDWRSCSPGATASTTPACSTRGRETPRPTMLAQRRASWAEGEDVRPSGAGPPGWWRRPPRLDPWNGHCKAFDMAAARKLLITGATGTLGQAFARICAHRGPRLLPDQPRRARHCRRSSIAAAIARARAMGDHQRRRLRPRWRGRAGEGGMPRRQRRSGRRSWPRLQGERASRSSPSRPIWSSTAGSAAPIAKATRSAPPACTAAARPKAEERRDRGSMADALIVRTSAFSARGTSTISLWNVLDRPRPRRAGQGLPERPRSRRPTCRTSSTRRSTC